MEPVRVWFVPISDDNETLACRAAVLAPQELERAHRFVFAADRARSITARAALRIAVGHLLECDPRDVPLSTTSAGQVVIDAPLHCSVSHSGELAAIALTEVGGVGVDVERERPLDEVAGVVERVLSESERAEWYASPSDERAALFFRYWTRKEAVSKAMGAGLNMPFERIVVTGDRTRAEVRECEAAGPWTLAAAYPRHGYTAAVAVRAHAASVEWLDWDESEWGPCRLSERSSMRS